MFPCGLMLVLVVGSAFATRRLATGSRRSRRQNILEIIVTAIEGQIGEIGLADPRRYVPFVGTLFLFIGASSLSSIVPSFEPPTGSMSTTVALALYVFVRVPVFGIAARGVGGYLASYVQPTVTIRPFNIISEASRTLALAVRLFGDMIRGVITVGILVSIMPLVFPVVMAALGLLIGMVQAYDLRYSGDRIHPTGEQTARRNRRRTSADLISRCKEHP